MVTALSNPGYGIKLKISTKAKLFVMKSKFKKNVVAIVCARGGSKDTIEKHQKIKW